MSLNLSELPNGIRVVTHEMKELHTASLTIHMDVGSRDEKLHQHGISHLLEHMAFKGTHKRSAHEIAEEIEAVGGDLNASTSVENTSYYTRMLKEDIGLGFDILADILSHSTFDEKEFIKEQHVILQEIGAALDTPDDVVFDKALEYAFPDQALGRPILGTEASVNSFHPQAVLDYLDEHYFGNAMVIAAAGNVKHEDILSYSEQLLGHYAYLPRIKREKALYKGGEYLDIKPLEQVHLVMGFEGLAIHDKDIYALQILTNIVGGGMSSRLFQQIREDKGLCYSIYSFHWAFQDSGFWGVYGATGEEDIKVLMPMILHVLQSMQDEVLESELFKARAQVKTALMMTLENSMGRAEQIALHIQTFGAVRSTEEILAAVNGVSIADIKRVASHILTSSPVTLSAIGPVSHIMRAEEMNAQLMK